MFRPTDTGPGELKIPIESDWAQGLTHRKSTSCAVILSKGCRSHAHSRGQALAASL